MTLATVGEPEHGAELLQPDAVLVTAWPSPSPCNCM